MGIERNYCSDKKIIFTHIPKVAGTSLLARLIRPNFQPEEIKTFRGVKNLFAERNGDFRVLVGHQPYGMHHFINGECNYFTMLREPISRAVSHYYFIRQPLINPNQKRYNVEQKKVYNETSLSNIFDRNRRRKYSLTSSWLIDNMQTRYIAGFAYYWAPKDSSLLLRAAKKNLKARYRTFGIQDRFQESLERLGQSFQISVGPEEQHLKTTRVEKTLTDLDKSVLMDNHRLDAELYEYACEIFNAG